MSAADHVGFILRDEPSHDVTIFHVSPDGECDLECMGKAVEIMAANGLGDSRIRQGCARSKHPATAILDEAASGEYAAVAIGRSGGKPEGVLGHIFGATGLKLLRNLEGAALWISR